LALYRTKRWSRGQALEMELAASFGSPSSPRREQLASEARKEAIQAAQAYQKASEQHARERKRYERVAMDPWISIESGSAAPGR
jgi:hypothetical protein